MIASHRYRPATRMVMRRPGNYFFRCSSRRFAALISQSCLSYSLPGFSMNSVSSGKRSPPGVTMVAWSAMYMYSVLPSWCVLWVDLSSGELDVCQWTPSMATRKLGRPFQARPWSAARTPAFRAEAGRTCAAGWRPGSPSCISPGSTSSCPSAAGTPCRNPRAA